jgi:transposase
MSDHSEAFVAFDTSKLRNAVAIADGGRAGEIRFLGEIENTGAATAKLVRKLAAKYQRLTFCYEGRPGTGSTGRSRASVRSAVWLRRR